MVLFHESSEICHRLHERIGENLEIASFLDLSERDFVMFGFE